jgi:hypothetical protein
MLSGRFEPSARGMGQDNVTMLLEQFYRLHVHKIRVSRGPTKFEVEIASFDPTSFFHSFPKR